MNGFRAHEESHGNPDRVALVTGGSDGIGAACVNEFVASGWRGASLALPGRDLDRQSANGVLTIAGDVTSAETREAAVEQTLGRYGRIDVLINSAGVGLFGVPSELPLECISRLFDINVIAPLALCRQVIPLMRKQGAGTIVNMGSVGGFVSLPWAAGYSASKAAFHSFHDSLRRELRGGPVHVLNVCPGIVDTHFREHALAGSAPAAVRQIRWVVSPQAVARRILRAIDRRSNTVFIPRIGALFALAGLVAPGLMDVFLSRFLAADRRRAVAEARSAAEAP
jgi:short-subunit dehydrogenase